MNQTILDLFDANTTSTTDGGDDEDGGGGPGGHAVGEVIVCYIYALICFVGAIGNGIVIFVILRFAKMRSATNHYICNLAVSDILFLVGLPLMIVTVMHRRWIFGYAMCKIFYILTSLNWFTSVFTLTVMSADRYLAVCHPISSIGYRTPVVSRWICVGVWLVSMLVMFPICFYANTEKFDELSERESCVIKWPHDDTIPADKAFIWYAFLVGFAVPTSLISIFYTLVVVRLRSSGPGNKRSQEKKKTHRKVTKMVLTVIAAYVICWLPYWIFQVSNTFMDHQAWMRTVVHVVTVLSYTNSTLNPFLYAFLAETFRRSFVKAVCCTSLSDPNRTMLHGDHSTPGAASKRDCHRGTEAASASAAPGHFKLRQDTRGEAKEGGGEKSCNNHFERDGVTVEEAQVI